jgi:hypothetical protein
VNGTIDLSFTRSQSDDYLLILVPVFVNIFFILSLLRGSDDDILHQGKSSS